MFKTKPILSFNELLLKVIDSDKSAQLSFVRDFANFKAKYFVRKYVSDKK